jgi:hypothetical protein
MPTATNDPDTTPITDWRLWWYASLEGALKRGDAAAARDALRHLERLGVEVRFTLPPLTGEAARD